MKKIISKNGKKLQLLSEVVYTKRVRLLWQESILGMAPDLINIILYY